MRGDRLRQLRESLDLSQAEFASLMGISEPTVWRYEHQQKEPSADLLLKFAEYFNVTADYLLGRSDNPGWNDLAPKEQAVISAWRRGDYREAIKVIVGDE